MNLRKIILFIICTFLSFSLFAKKAEPAPKWLSDLNSVYPDSEYIAKIGSGKKVHQSVWQWPTANKPLVPLEQEAQTKKWT